MSNKQYQQLTQKQPQNNLNVKDLQFDTMPSFSGISGQFFEQAATYINYAVSANQQITKTPQNKAGQVKMQQIIRKLNTPKKLAHQVGNSMACSQAPATTFLDQTSNNATIIKDYAQSIIAELIKTDIEYQQQKMYGDFDYLLKVQQGKGAKFVGLHVDQRSISGRSIVNSRSFQSSQQKQRVLPSYQQIPQSEIIQQKDVLKTVDYICQVIYKESYCLETQYFAVSLLHRALSKIQVKRSELKLLAAVCVFAATKHEENYGEALGSSALVAYFGDAFQVNQVLQSELRFLDAIEWRLGVSAVNARAYLRTLFRDLGFSLQLCVLASYLAEITLLNPKFLQFAQFEIALAAIELAVLSAWRDPFPGIEQQKSAIQQLFVVTTAANINASFQNKLQCRKSLSEEWCEIQQKGQATQIYKKYCDKAYYQVALRKPIGDADELASQIVEKL